MTEPVVRDEQAVPECSIPWSEVPGWRDRFGVVAGVTERGDPAVPFDLGLAGTAPIGAVLDRWRSVREAFPGTAGIVVARQVHGATVLWHDRSAAAWSVFEGADGHATNVPGLLLAVSLADCIPIYLVDPARRTVALLHSGWRGTAANILAEGVALLGRRVGSSPGGLVAHVGVGICGACYQVSAEVATRCGVPADASPVQLDLRAAIARQARALGVADLSVSSLCSGHHSDRFMSHRRSGGADGRMIALLGLLPG